MTFHLGDVARLCGLSVVRVRRWVRSGFIHPDQDQPPGTGNYLTFSANEVAVAQAVARVVKRHRVPATRGLFEQTRAQLTPVTTGTMDTSRRVFHGS